MKSRRCILLLTGLVLLFIVGACRDTVERPDNLSLFNDKIFLHDTAFVIANQPVEAIDRVVLIEEMTGVYCYTCPLAHDTVAALIEKYPGRIAVTNIHSHAFGIYDNPKVLGNKYDFRTADGDSIVAYLGGVISVPSASIDRVVHPPDTSIISFKRANWQSYVAQQIAQPSFIDIRVINTTGDLYGFATVNIKIHFTKAFSSRIGYIFAVVENDIVDKQFKDTTVVKDYHHQHILRRMETDIGGRFLASNPSSGQVFVRVHRLEIPDYNLRNVRYVVAVVNLDSKEILQSKEVHY